MRQPVPAKSALRRQLSQAIRGDGIQNGGVLAGCAGQAKTAMRVPRSNVPEQDRNVIADVSALPQKYRHHDDCPAASCAKLLDRDVQVGRHELEIGQHDAGFRCVPGDAFAEAFEGLGPARVASTVGEKDKTVGHRTIIRLGFVEPWPVTPGSRLDDSYMRQGDKGIARYSFSL